MVNFFFLYSNMIIEWKTYDDVDFFFNFSSIIIDRDVSYQCCCHHHHHHH